MLSKTRFAQSRSPLLSRYCETMGEMTLRDYTEKAMNAARVEAELASKAKSSLLGTMSHELRTPLNAIIGFSELIEGASGGEISETMAEHATEIRKAGRHMLGVINDILDMSKIESGAMQLNLSVYHIGEIIEDCLPMVRERIADKQQTLDVRIAKDVPALTLDMRRVRQVVLNLLSNAHKFTPEGGTITVSARRNKDDGATIAIADTGTGMTPDEMRTAMRPFGQVQNMYTRSQEGSGLGLAIAQGLIHAHGGDFFLESEPGVGTCVVLTLPPKKPDMAYARPVYEGGGERRRARRPNLATSGDKT